MEKTVNIHTAKTTLSKLVAEVENGGEVVIARAGKPVARLVGVGKKARAQAKTAVDRKPGFMKGKIWIGPDFDEPLPPDMLVAMLGEDG
ncbi:MAG: type II toxin-antitoxin system prevent-host-death family antitoxin [Rhizomicrobium sp.]